MSQRGSGATTAQMQAAPQGAVFIWCNDGLSYPKALAMELNRTDLKIVGLSVLNSQNCFAGMSAPPVLDHAALQNMSSEQKNTWINLVRYWTERER